MKKSIYCMVISSLMVSVAANGMFVFRQTRRPISGAQGQTRSYNSYGRDEMSREIPAGVKIRPDLNKRDLLEDVENNIAERVAQQQKVRDSFRHWIKHGIFGYPDKNFAELETEIGYMKTYKESLEDQVSKFGSYGPKNDE